MVTETVRVECCVTFSAAKTIFVPRLTNRLDLKDGNESQREADIQDGGHPPAQQSKPVENTEDKEESLRPICVAIHRCAFRSCSS